MKDLWFRILVILLTPIYLIIYIVKLFFEKIIEFTEDFIEPIEEGALILFENMQDFWKKVLKGTKEK